MLRKSNGWLWAVSRACVAALGVGLIVVCAMGSAFAFPTPGTTVQINSVGVITGAEVEHINIGNSSESVYMGPYNITATNGSSFVVAMMCFNAAAIASAGPALATDTAGASAIFGADKINMIAWLASQWVISDPLATGKNADINKAMWEIMADYGSKDGLSVDGNAATKGSFFLDATDSADIKDVNDILLDALKHTKAGTPADFIIPGSMVDGKWVYDTTKQPFVQPVPEPATLLLLGSGLVGLGLGGWRKRNKAQR